MFQVTINQLVRTIGHELGASEDKIKTIVRHLDSVVSMAIQEASEQQEVVEDLQFVENFIPAANERLLVHQNSFEFGIAEASLLSPLIFSPPDQQHNVVVNNNDKRPSLVSVDGGSSKSHPTPIEDRRMGRFLRATTATTEPLQFIDGAVATVVNPPQLRIATATVTVLESSGHTPTSATSSPRELVTFANE